MPAIVNEVGCHDTMIPCAAIRANLAIMYRRRQIDSAMEAQLRPDQSGRSA
jgi:hypothetical protein